MELMNKPVMEAAPKTLTRTRLIIITLSVGSKSGVDALTIRLKRDGYTVINDPRTTGDGYYKAVLLVLRTIRSR